MAKSGDNSNKALAEVLNGALADHLALYVKTKNFHWHVAGPRFRSLHLLFDDQATQILGLTDIIAERVRKIGFTTLTSIGSIGATTAIADQDNADITADAMVTELRDDNSRLIERLKQVKHASEEAEDFPTNGMVDDWIDQAQERVWFLGQTAKD